MAADNIDDVLAGILQSLSGMPLIGTLAAAVSRLHEGTTALTKALTDIVSKITAIPKAPTAPPSPPGGGPAGPGGLPGGGGGAGGALGKLAMAGAAAAAALGLVVVAINIVQEAFNKAKEWVNLFNPGVIMAFQHALDNLGATIGRAFVPVFQMMIGVVRSMTAMLAPIMAQLAPVMKEFADQIGGVLLGYIKNFASLLRGLIPWLQVMKDVWVMLGQVLVNGMSTVVLFIRAIALGIKVLMELSPIGVILKIVTKAFEGLNMVMGIVHEAMDILTIFITTIVDSIVAFIASFIPVDDIMNKLKETIQFVIRNMYVFAIMMARMTGLNSVADNLIKHVEGKLKRGDTAAQTPQIKDIEQLSRDLALAAAAAGGAASGSKVADERDFWQKTLEEMQAAKANGLSIQDLLREIRDEIIRRLPNPGNILGIDPPSGGATGGGGLPGKVARGTDRVLDSGALGAMGLAIGGLINPR